MKTRLIELFPHVHRVAKYWVHKEGPKIAILSATYYSSDLEAINKPNSKIQNTALLIQTGIDIESELFRLSITCK